MLVYLLKFSACLAILLVFYRLFLEKENMHVFKRYYLLLALGFSFIVPLITFTEYVNALPVPDALTSTSNTMNNINSVSTIDYWIIFICVIYALGVIIFGAKFLLNIYTIYKRINLNPKYKSDTFINVLLKDLNIPHTFFNYIFLNQKQFEAREIPNEVLLHEQAHAKQKHSIDILVIEFLIVIFWFHPLIHFLKTSVKLNHEFLADQAVLNNGIESKAYQNLLLTYSTHSSELKLANAINYSLIKKRFTIMKTTTSKSSIWIRTLVILPLITLTLYGFSDTKTIIITDSATNSEEINVQKGATKEQIMEYNRLAKHYNSQPEDQIIYKKKDLERMKYLYHLMSEDQRKQAESFPVKAPPPPKPPKSAEKAPTVLSIKVVPPPPPPIPDEATPAQKKKYKEAQKIYKQKAKLYKQKAKLKNEKKSLVEVREVEAPSPPPAPKSPLDHVVEMSKKGAVFYFEGKKISSDEAISLLKKNKQINISTKGSKSKQPVVHLSTKPIVIEN